jgi:ribonuclease R
MLCQALFKGLQIWIGDPKVLCLQIIHYTLPMTENSWQKVWRRPNVPNGRSFGSKTNDFNRPRPTGYIKPQYNRAQESVGVFKQVGEDFGFIDPIIDPSKPVLETAPKTERMSDGVFVHARKSLDALDGDTVSYRTMMGRSGKTEAIITHVKKRSPELHFGIYSIIGGSSGVKLFDRGIVVRVPDPTRTLIQAGTPKKSLENGVTVGIRVGGYGRSLEGIIGSILGREGEGNYYQELLLAQSAVPRAFTPELLAAAAASRSTPWTAGVRRDLRGRTIITIDGSDAKDLDDAIEVEKTPIGYRLSVHIADVSAYVEHGKLVDIEAARRGTSIYLADGVIPMLPETLSNDLCSLNPHTDKLCLSISLDLNPAAKVMGVEVYESLISSVARTTYLEVEKDRAGEAILPEVVHAMLMNAWELKAAIDIRRKKEGKIAFLSHEAKCLLSPEGKLIDLISYPSYPSNDLIEAFMVIANEEVSRWATSQSLMIPYRVHPVPTAIGLTRLAELLRNYDIHLALANPEKPTSREIARCIDLLIEADPDGFSSKGAISSMAKAFYSEKSVGHFGLALQYYSHFTSPIRRYPDLLLHRAIKGYIARTTSTIHPSLESKPLTKPEASALYKKCSELEVRAEKLEYAYRDTLICEWLQPRIGEEFTGRVTSIMDKWVFVEFLPFVEGFLGGNIPESLHRVGASLSVILQSASMKTRKIDLKLAPMWKQVEEREEID